MLTLQNFDGYYRYEVIETGWMLGMILLLYIKKK